MTWQPAETAPVSRVAYLAHPLNAETLAGIDTNRRNAAAWGAWLLRSFGIAISADYLWLSTQWDESPENRRLGLEADKAQIDRCNLVILVGGRISTGMAIEIEHAGGRGKPVLDLTPFGFDAPSSHDYERESAIGNAVFCWLAEIENGQPLPDAPAGRVG